MLDFRFSGALDMKRLLLAVACVFIFGAGEVSAAAVSGKISFVTRRGQRPNVAETLVWLEPLANEGRPQSGTFQMTTRSKTVIPHVLAVPVGSTIAFPNEDPISHNLFSLSAGNAFDLGLYRRGAGKSQRFDTPGAVNVYCNVHPNMSAVIHVMPTPYFTFVDGNGEFSVDVPPGKYRLIAWNEQGGTISSDIEVTPEKVVGNLALILDSSNFRRTQHTNKFGKPYQAPSSREY